MICFSYKNDLIYFTEFGYMVYSIGHKFIPNSKIIIDSANEIALRSNGDI